MIIDPQPVIKPEYYFQPILKQDFQRNLRGKEEIVSYLGNTSMRIWLNKENTDYLAHWHSALEVVMPIDKGYTITLKDSFQRISPGDVFIIPPREMHGLKCSQNGARMIYLFDESVLVRLGVYPLFKRLFSGARLISPKTEPEMHAVAEQIFREIGNAYFEFGEVRELMIYSLLLKFFTAYGSYRLPLIQDRQDLSARRRKSNYEKIESAMKYMNENYREDLRVESLADRAHLSRFHFARLLKEYANVTFHEYLTRRRVEEATSLLAGSGKYITDIAFQSGFPSISAFNRSFKKYTNRTPREYKREAST